MSSRLPADGLHFGLGLVSIGRIWGVGRSPVPEETEAEALLQAAIDNGIRIFDTAPAYGASERRLGAFLKHLPVEVRGTVMVMTKAGEHWDDDAGAAYVDHGADAMARSLDRSIELLGRIDLLQLHKATEEAIASPATEALVRRARAAGIARFGASVSSVAAGRLALKTGLFSALQFPFNATSRDLEPLLADLEAARGVAVVNRPYAMGGLVHDAGDRTAAGIAAFRFQRERTRRGIVLTGTSRTAHLVENVRNFRAAMA